VVQNVTDEAIKKAINRGVKNVSVQTVINSVASDYVQEGAVNILRRLRAEANLHKHFELADKLTGHIESYLQGDMDVQLTAELVYQAMVLDNLPEEEC
jgi:hypothetical protein